MSAASFTYQNEVYDQLNLLLRKIRSSTREYVSVSNAFPNREGRNLVRLFMKERGSIADQLLHTIRHLGGNPTDANLAQGNGALGSKWESFKRSRRVVPEVALLKVCESMDAQLVSEYDDLFSDGNLQLPYAYVEILREHRNILALEVENLSAYRHYLEDLAALEIKSTGTQLDQPMLTRTA